MSIKRLLIHILVCTFFLGVHTISAYGQSKKQVRLLDQDSGLPIQDVSFEYGDQSGVSTEDGVLHFFYVEGFTMKLSHMNYGTWQWTDNQLVNIIQQEMCYCQSVSVSLYPVTVLALRSGQKPSEGLTLEYQHKLAHDAADVLNQTPMINSIRKSGQYGFDPVFRGFKYDQLNIVYNGAQSATAACPNRMDPPTSQMAPNMIDKIEVLKGPHALRYGTGFGATINFVPVQLHFTNKAHTYGRVSSGYKNNGEVFTSEGQMGFSNKAYDFSVYGAWAQGNDYEAGNGQAVQSDFERGSFGANLGVKLSSKQQLRLSSVYNMARDVDFAALPMDLRKDDTWMFNARHQMSLNKEYLTSWNTTLFASFVDHLMDNLLKPMNPRTMDASTPAKTYNYGARTEGVWRFKKGKRLYAGADWRTEGAKGTRIRSFLMGPNAGKTVKDNAWQKGHIDKLGVFGEYHMDGNVLQFVFSGRMEMNNANADDVDVKFSKTYTTTQQTQFNPSVSMGVSRRFDKGIKLGLWLGRAQRSAGLTERFINYFPVGQDPYEMLGNPQLHPEVNNQLDLTLEWAEAKTAVDIDVFGSYMQDFISSVIETGLSPTLPSSPGVRRYVNIDEAFKMGFEFNWTQELWAGMHHQLAMAYTYAKDIKREQPLPEIAPLDFRYTLRGVYFKDKLLPEASLRHVLKQSRVASEYGETETPAFSLLDVKLAYHLSAKVSLSVGVHNLLNENYYEHLSRAVRGTTEPIFAPGRNVYASLNVRF